LQSVDLTNSSSSNFCAVDPSDHAHGVSCYLSSIWMSGFGLAADSSGSIFFVTGNSGAHYSPPTNYLNLQESVVKVAPDLSSVVDVFTPRNLLEGGDPDFGAGGALLLPDQSESSFHLAVAAGKDGNMYLLDRDKLGGLSPSGPPASIIGGSPIPARQIAPALAANGSFPNSMAGPAYFMGADGVGRVVSSGDKAMVWKVATSASNTPMLQIDTWADLSGKSPHRIQAPGFFPTVSSNGTREGSTIVWAVERPLNFGTMEVTLHAIDPSKNDAVIFSHPAGIWPHANANANIVPVVSNGKVFVASYKELEIFGLNATGRLPQNDAHSITAQRNSGPQAVLPNSFR
jgi:hypothetical protein